MKLKILLLVILLYSMLPSTASAYFNYSYTATDTVYVSEQFPAANFAGAGTDYIGRDGVGEDRALLKFNIAGLTNANAIDTATLVVSNTAGGNTHTINVKEVTSSWSEAAVTWNTQPTYGSVANSLVMSGTGTYRIDVTNSVKSMVSGSITNNGWAFIDSTPSGALEAGLNPKGGAGQPILLINYSNVSVGNWTFNQGTGAYANDSSGFNNNGTLFGDRDWSTNLVNGSVNSTSLNFTGSNYVNASNASSLNLSTSDFTLTGWIKLTTDNPFYYVGKFTFNPSSQGYRISSTAGGAPNLQVANGVTAVSVPGTTAINDNKWHYITAKRGSDIIYIYVDNVLEGFCHP